jgi:glutamine synthetase
MSTSKTGYEELRSKLAQQGVRFLLPSYVDMHGVPKSKMVPIDHLAQMAEGS